MALIERIIDARLASDEGGAPRDLFDLLRSARDPETGAAFTREQLRDQVATMIVAGHETTALALFWSLYLLANATGWQDAIAAETSGLDLGAERRPMRWLRLFRPAPSSARRFGFIRQPLR